MGNISQKILITGSSGMVGRTLIKKIKNVAEVYAIDNTKADLEGLRFYQLDIRDEEQVISLVKKIQPNTVIHLAARRNTKYCEENPDEAYEVNVRGTENIARACKNTNAKMVFASSDQVFDGTKGEYREEDGVNPLNAYGKQKAIAEKNIRDNLDDWLILRASYIYGWSPGRDNFVTWAIENLRDGREIQISCDQFVTPIHVENFVDILIKLLENKKRGIYHIGEGECLNKYEFIKRIKEIFHFNEAVIKPVLSEVLNQNIIRPKKNCLNLSKIKNEIDFSQYSIKKGLEILKKEGAVDLK